MTDKDILKVMNTFLSLKTGNTEGPDTWKMAVNNALQFAKKMGKSKQWTIDNYNLWWPEKWAEFQLHYISEAEHWYKHNHD